MKIIKQVPNKKWQIQVIHNVKDNFDYFRRYNPRSEGVGNFVYSRFDANYFVPITYQDVKLYVMENCIFEDEIVVDTSKNYSFGKFHRSSFNENCTYLYHLDNDPIFYIKALLSGNLKLGNDSIKGLFTFASKSGFLYTTPYLGKI